MDHRRGRGGGRRRRRRSPRRLCSSTSPKLKSHRPYASRVRANMRAHQEDTPRGKDRPTEISPNSVCVCVYVYAIIVVPLGEKSRWAGR